MQGTCGLGVSPKQRVAWTVVSKPSCRRPRREARTGLSVPRYTGWKPVPRRVWLGRLAQAACGLDSRVQTVALASAPTSLPYW
ncbi:MAG: hypothetical protein NZM28_10125, partial [Fimbriimonadales bacterium]|nr:hypothetical protein [Fimbriimonadales bacterium]